MVGRSRGGAAGPLFGTGMDQRRAGKATDFGFAIAPGETLHLLAREQMGGFGFSARIFPATDANSVARAAGGPGRCRGAALRPASRH